MGTAGGVEQEHVITAELRGLQRAACDACRVLAFDEQAARRYAEIVSRRERLGRAIGFPDAQIAAICRAIGATLATRNTDDFEETGIDLINPWKLA